MSFRTAFHTIEHDGAQAADGRPSFLGRRLRDASCVFFCAVVLACGARGATSRPAPGETGPDDPTAWAPRAEAFLQQVVTDEGLVHYESALALRDDLDNLVHALGQPREFATHEQKLACFINAYNLLVIQGVVEAWPVESVRDIKDFFKRRHHQLNGEPASLNVIENELIRPLGDARIHAALVCGAVSCPPLLRGLFRAETLDAQLDRVASAWVNDRAKNDVRHGALWISRIFKWYREDFEKAPYKGVVDFLASHAEEDSPLAAKIAGTRSLRVRYLHYDWSLNTAPSEDD